MQHISASFNKGRVGNGTDAALPDGSVLCRLLDFDDGGLERLLEDAEKGRPLTALDESLRALGSAAHPFCDTSHSHDAARFIFCVFLRTNVRGVYNRFAIETFPGCRDCVIAYHYHRRQLERALTQHFEDEQDVRERMAELRRWDVERVENALRLGAGNPAFESAVFEACCYGDYYLCQGQVMPLWQQEKDDVITAVAEMFAKAPAERDVAANGAENEDELLMMTAPLSGAHSFFQSCWFSLLCHPSPSVRRIAYEGIDRAIDYGDRDPRLLASIAANAYEALVTLQRGLVTTLPQTTPPQPSLARAIDQCRGWRAVSSLSELGLLGHIGLTHQGEQQESGATLSRPFIGVTQWYLSATQNLLRLGASWAEREGGLGASVPRETVALAAAMLHAFRALQEEARRGAAAMDGHHVDEAGGGDGWLKQMERMAAEVTRKGADELGGPVEKVLSMICDAVDASLTIAHVALMKGGQGLYSAAAGPGGPSYELVVWQTVARAAIEGMQLLVYWAESLSSLSQPQQLFALIVARSVKLMDHVASLSSSVMSPSSSASAVIDLDSPSPLSHHQALTTFSQVLFLTLIAHRDRISEVDIYAPSPQPEPMLLVHLRTILPPLERVITSAVATDPGDRPNLVCVCHAGLAGCQCCGMEASEGQSESLPPLTLRRDVWGDSVCQLRATAVTSLFYAASRAFQQAVHRSNGFVALGDDRPSASAGARSSGSGGGDARQGIPDGWVHQGRPNEGLSPLLHLLPVALKASHANPQEWEEGGLMTSLWSLVPAFIQRVPLSNLTGMPSETQALLSVLDRAVDLMVRALVERLRKYAAPGAVIDVQTDEGAGVPPVLPREVVALQQHREKYLPERFFESALESLASLLISGTTSYTTHVLKLLVPLSQAKGSSEAANGDEVIVLAGRQAWTCGDETDRLHAAQLQPLLCHPAERLSFLVGFCEHAIHTLDTMATERDLWSRLIASGNVPAAWPSFGGSGGQLRQATLEDSLKRAASETNKCVHVAMWPPVRLSRLLWWASKVIGWLPAIKRGQDGDPARAREEVGTLLGLVDLIWSFLPHILGPASHNTTPLKHHPHEWWTYSVRQMAAAPPPSLSIDALFAIVFPFLADFFTWTSVAVSGLPQPSPSPDDESDLRQAMVDLTGDDDEQDGEGEGEGVVDKGELSLSLRRHHMEHLRDQPMEWVGPLMEWIDALDAHVGPATSHLLSARAASSRLREAIKAIYTDETLLPSPLPQDLRRLLQRGQDDASSATEVIGPPAEDDRKEKDERRENDRRPPGREKKRPADKGDDERRRKKHKSGSGDMVLPALNLSKNDNLFMDEDDHVNRTSEVAFPRPLKPAAAASVPPAVPASSARSRPPGPPAPAGPGPSRWISKNDKRVKQTANKLVGRKMAAASGRGAGPLANFKQRGAYPKGRVFNPSLPGFRRRSFRPPSPPAFAMPGEGRMVPDKHTGKQMRLTVGSTGVPDIIKRKREKQSVKLGVPLRSEDKKRAWAMAKRGVEGMLADILQWDIFQLAATGRDTRAVTPLSGERKQLPREFASLEEFQECFRPLVLDECRCSIIQSAVERVLEGWPIKVVERRRADRWLLARFQSGQPLNDQTEKLKALPFHNADLVVLIPQPAPPPPPPPLDAMQTSDTHAPVALPLPVPQEGTPTATNGPLHGQLLSAFPNGPDEGYLLGVVEMEREGETNRWGGVDEQLMKPEDESGKFPTLARLRVLAHAGGNSENRLPAQMGTPSLWAAYSVCSLTTSIREFQSLFCSQFSPLFPLLLQPSQLTTRGQQPAIPLPPSEGGGAVVARVNEMLPKLAKHHKLNESQAAAMKEAVTSKLGLSLLQGPPGTGKTATLLALLSVLAERRLILQDARDTRDIVGSPISASGAAASASASQRAPLRMKILVCAPSNAAVDEVACRVLRDGLFTPGGSRWDPNIVRVGHPERITRPELKSYSLEVRVRESEGATQSGVRDQYAQQLEKLKMQLDEIDRLMPESAELDTLRHQKAELTKEKKAIRAKMESELEGCRGRCRRESLRRADIVFATLSGSATECLGDFAPFDSVIVDEAAQAVELSTLIPLRLGLTRMILLGDPQQLPATVLSQQAKRLSYDRSLFQRLQEGGWPVSMLRTQYRMAPEIAGFPSACFYQNQIINDNSVVIRPRLACHPVLRPFVFFDLPSPESKNQHSLSLSNRGEALFICQLLEFFRNHFHQNPSEDNPHPLSLSSIVVLCPYKQQVVLIRRLLADRSFIEGQPEVRTIDSIQGREARIIIFSCVRASVHAPQQPASSQSQQDSSGDGTLSQTGSPRSDRDGGRGISQNLLGFVSDTRRMNVAITRARDALWVVGNAPTLSTHPLWKRLVRYAKGLNDGNGGYIKIDDQEQPQRQPGRYWRGRCDDRAPAPAPAAAAASAADNSDRNVLLGERALRRSIDAFFGTLDRSVQGVQESLGRLSLGDTSADGARRRERDDGSRGRRGDKKKGSAKADKKRKKDSGEELSPKRRRDADKDDNKARGPSPISLRPSSKQPRERPASQDRKKRADASPDASAPPAAAAAQPTAGSPPSRAKPSKRREMKLADDAPNPRRPPGPKPQPPPPPPPDPPPATAAFASSSRPPVPPQPPSFRPMQVQAAPPMLKRGEGSLFIPKPKRKAAK
ncbi:unnamed protein product [Vitrella brassicaformis CCMP3155]|uniref:DNA2/NAM7 helicase helicase domain-containing protein n=6 Tax=Vitrella brassicaformis TaxID=1169539 RepID=A0A0G4H5R4_VITBC|nr:unnamed protein product [Vitrella brassicaformis CCMP3155]|eukprot:CEM39177.1 unnamed protein product [Vitrella brassicaformis CCMP3155]